MTQTAHRATPPTPPTPSGNPSTAQTVGQQLHASPVARNAVQAIVGEIRAKSAQITDVRPADPALKASYEALMKRAAEVRGRGLLYPYIGSGVGNGALVEAALPAR